VLFHITSLFVSTLKIIYSATIQQVYRVYKMRCKEHDKYTYTYNLCLLRSKSEYVKTPLEHIFPKLPHIYLSQNIKPGSILMDKDCKYSLHIGLYTSATLSKNIRARALLAYTSEKPTHNMYVHPSHTELFKIRCDVI
jgi:hypothetical protein